MAIKEITYDNKVDLQLWGNVPDVNKIKADDMNEIKNIVNNNAKELILNEDNQIHIETEQSSTINVQDCSNLSAKIDVFGVSNQETRSGKNKFDIEKLTGNNITNKDSETGSFTMSNCWSTTIMNNASLQELLKSNTQYKCIADVTLLSKPENLNTANSNQILSLYNKQDLIVTNILSTSTKQEKDDWEVNTTKHLNVTFTTPNNLTGFEVIGYNYRTNNSTNEGSFKFENIMILEVTEEDETFEQYGASPSPEFPSEIENVTGNIEITVCNKNLYENIEDGYINTTTGQNQTSTINKRSVGNILLSKNKQLKLIRYDNNKGIRFYYYELNGDYIESSVSSSVSELNTNVYNREVLLRYVLMNTMSDEDIKCMLCNINSNSDYIEHEEQIITFPLQKNQKLCKKDYLANNGIHHVLQFLKLQGTEIFAEYSPTIYNPLNICAFRLQQTLPKNADTSLALSTHFSLKDLAQNNINPEANKFSYYTDEGRSDNGLYFFINYEDIGVQSTDTSEQKIEKFKNWLVQQKTNNTPVTVGYGLSKENEVIETFTEAQQEAYDQLQNVTPYKLVTNISTDKAELVFKYIADTKTYVDNEINSIKSQLNTINELLSTANTSAMLLDNLQTDLESEVL